MGNAPLKLIDQIAVLLFMAAIFWVLVGRIIYQLYVQAMAQ